MTTHDHLSTAPTTQNAPTRPIAPTTPTAWAPADLARIGRTDEVGFASIRADGSVRPYVTIWAVRVDDDVVIRSARGASNPWFRRAVAGGVGRLRASGLVSDVMVSPKDPDDVATHAAIDAAYHAKYDRYGAAIVGSVVGPAATAVTLVLRPLAS